MIEQYVNTLGPKTRFFVTKNGRAIFQCSSMDEARQMARDNALASGVSEQWAAVKCYGPSAAPYLADLVSGVSE